MNAIITLQVLHDLGYRMRVVDGKVRISGSSEPSWGLQAQIRRNRKGLICLLEEGLPLQSGKEGAA